jgi:hypothetical protein
MSSIFSGYASFFTEQTSRFLSSSSQAVSNNLAKASNLEQISVNNLPINDQTFDLLKKFLAYSLVSTVVASSAFYIGFNYAKKRNRFDPRSPDDDKTDQV